MARDRLTFEDLLRIARRVGVDVVAAPSSHRGQLGYMGTVCGCTLHHTGTPNSVRPAEDYPDYEVVKEGRPGLRNSLSAFGLGRHRAIYVFSECLSWHAGDWLFDGITDGNGHFLGIEAAGVGDWTPWQVDIYPRLVASILLEIDEGVDMMPRHADGAMPRGRKTDAANLPKGFAATVQRYLDHPELIPVSRATAVPEEDPMIVTVAAGKTEVIPLPFIPAGKKLYARFAVDEANGGCNARVAVGWGTSKFHALPGLDKVDGFTGWLVNGAPNETELGGSDASLVVTHKGARNPLGVLLQLR